MPTQTSRNAFLGGRAKTFKSVFHDKYGKPFTPLGRKRGLKKIKKKRRSASQFETDTPPQGPLLAAAAAPCRVYLFTHSAGY